jgi:hypothetical protein
MIDESFNYYLGSWRRCPFDPAVMPQSLNVDEASISLKLANFDTEYNNLWRFKFVQPELFALELLNPSSSLKNKFPGARPLCVSSSLTITDNDSQALLFSMTAHDPFRQGPLDVSILIHDQDGSVLVSNEKTGRVMLADLHEAQQRLDRQGNFVINIAWEATPDVDDAIQGSFEDVPAWVHETLAT